MNRLDKLYLKLNLVGTIRIRNLCDAGLFDEVRIEAEHLHQIPSLIGCTVPYPHFFYWRVHRQRYLDAMDRVASADSRSQIDEIYRSLWTSIDNAIFEAFGEDTGD